LLYYILNTQKRSLYHLLPFELYTNKDYLGLDLNAVKNLELIESLKGAKNKNNLFLLNEHPSILEEKEGKMTNVLQENLTGIRVVKAFANENYEIEKFNKSLDEYTSIWKRTTKRMSVFWGISDILTYTQLLYVFI
jgi:ABC-type multidrug transport system fused ATPase/permease subunit